MMMGFGSYGGNAHGGGGGPSNLSALAPPFTVDRSTPKPRATPLVDLGEPLNWLDSNPFSFKSTQPAQLPQLDLDPIPTPSYNQNSDLFEPNIYYPPFVSPTLHVPTFNEQSLSGLDHTAQWGGGGLWDWEKGKAAQLGGNFYPKEANEAPSSIYTDHINAGAHPSNSLKTCEESSHNIYSLGREKQVGPPNVEKLDYNPVLGQNFSYVPVDYLKTSVIRPSSALPETNLRVPPLNLINSKNQVPFSTPCEKPVRQLSNTPSDIPAMESSPGIVIRPADVDSCSSASNTVSFKNVNTGINRIDTNLTGNNPSNVKEPHYLLNFGSKNESDPSQISFHLDGNCYLSGESSETMTEKLSTSNVAFKDASDYFSRTNSGVAFSHSSPENFSLALDNSKPVIAVENYLESLDHYNPHIDSPCWKGAPDSYNSPFGSSEPVSVQLVRNLEAWDGSNGQALKFIPMNTANMLKLPSEKQSEIRITVENGNKGDSSVSTLTLPSVSIPSSREHQPDDAGKAGSYEEKTSYASEIKFSDGASEQKKDYVLFNKSVDEVETASCTIRQSLAEGRLISKNLHTSENGVAILEMKTNDVSGGGSSHMSCHAVNDLSCLPSSVEDISTKHSKLSVKGPVSDSSFSVLVYTMQNLSELLLYQCCNETCELKEKDLKSLEKVIYNLDTCMSKNIEQKSIFNELHEGTSKGRPEVAAIDVLSQHVQEKRKHSGKKDGKCSDFVSVKIATDIKAKNDNMTKAIKKVLMGNFNEKEEEHPQVLLYKNLWLEAEAALCSINYMARFNNMKIEIEKCKLDSEKELSEDSPDDDNISRSKFSAEVNAEKKLTAAAESEAIPAVSKQNSPIKSSSYHADDVTARFHVLKKRLNNSNSVHTRDVDKLFSSKLSLDLNEVGKLAPEVKDSSTPGMPSQESLVPGTACHTNNVEASVVARFHILKSRGIDDLDSNEMERKLLPEVVGLGFAGKRTQIHIDEVTTVDGISGANVEPVSLNQVANLAGEQLVVKDFHLCIPGDCSIQSPGSTRLGNQLSAGRYENCSSDWEHVLKEELSGQNS